jgi:redox-sensing transcriptional repressor
MQKKISEPSIVRLCLIYRLLEEMEAENIKTVYSSGIGERIGANAHSVRKDMGILGDIGNNLAGYDVTKLKNHIYNTLGFKKPWNACVVGLGRLGTAILNYTQSIGNAFQIVAGFDNDINKLEMIETAIDVYPAYKIEEIVSAKKIELAILAVPKDSSQQVADRLVDCGINGIINFTPVILNTSRDDVFIRNMDLVTEMRILSALLSLKADKEEISL